MTTFRWQVVSCTALLALVGSCSEDSATASSSQSSTAMSTGAGTGGGAGGGAAAASGGGGSTAASGGDSAGGAGGSGSPTRMVLIYTPHGTQPDWAPSGSGQSFTLSTILQPFESIKSQLLVIAGLDLPPPPTGISTHQTGSASLLTGSFGSCDSIQDECFAGGPSLDELVGSSDTPFYSLALAANIVGGPASHITYNAVDAPAIPETNPQTIVDQVFSNINESESSPEIDALIAKAGTLTPSSPLDQLSGFLFGVVREALALDLTRVAVVQLGCHTPTFVPSWLGFNDDYHQITHGSDSMSMAAVEAVQSWFASEIADFANKLAQRSLLDNTVIVWLSDMGSPPMAHSNQDIPVVIVGDANGRLKSGQFLQLDRNHVDLLLTLGQLMDPNLTTFGDPSLASAPIVEIVTP